MKTEMSEEELQQFRRLHMARGGVVVLEQLIDDMQSGRAPPELLHCVHVTLDVLKDWGGLDGGAQFDEGGEDDL